MQENRKAMRFDIHVPLQIYTSQSQPPEFHAGQLRDVSRTGVLFHAQGSYEIGTTFELAFCVPAEKERNSCVLVRATVKTVRTRGLPGGPTALFGIAAAIDRIDFAQPAASSAASAWGIHRAVRDGLLSNGSLRVGEKTHPGEPKVRTDLMM